MGKTRLGQCECGAFWSGYLECPNCGRTKDGKLTGPTPGPWEIRGQDIYGNGPNGYICSWSGRRANSHLIVAAPDMFAWLKDDLDSEECICDSEDDTIKCRSCSMEALIAKANGKS